MSSIRPNWVLIRKQSIFIGSILTLKKLNELILLEGQSKVSSIQVGNDDDFSIGVFSDGAIHKIIRFQGSITLADSPLIGYQERCLFLR